MRLSSSARRHPSYRPQVHPQRSAASALKLLVKQATAEAIAEVAVPIGRASTGTQALRLHLSCCRAWIFELLVSSRQEF